MRSRASGYWTSLGRITSATDSETQLAFWMLMFGSLYSCCRSPFLPGEARAQGSCRVEVEGLVAGAGEVAREARAEGRCRGIVGILVLLSAAHR